MELPVVIPNRPFATERFSGLMMPDGIFEASMGAQRLNAQFRSVGVPLTDLSIRISSVSNPAIQFDAGAIYAPVNLGTEASTLLGWDINLATCPPGEHSVTFEVVQIRILIDAASAAEPVLTPSPPGRLTTTITKKIFVTRVDYDHAKKQFSAEVPQGTVTVRFTEMSTPRQSRASGGSKKIVVPPLVEIFGTVPPLGSLIAPTFIPTGIELSVTYKQPVAGHTVDLPFKDPYWKVVIGVIMWILFIIAAILFLVEITANLVSKLVGKYDDWKKCCETPITGATLGFVAAGLVTWCVAALADDGDPFRKGQLKTAPLQGELTTGERVQIAAHPLGPVATGRPFAIKTSWKYHRDTTGKTYKHSAQEHLQNEHVLTRYEITAPNVVRVAEDPTFVVRGEFIAPRGRFAGDDLFVLCTLEGQGPLKGQSRRFLLQDNGVVPDEHANDGIYTGKLAFADVDKGFWKIYVTAQDVNNAQAHMQQDDAAKIIGGILLTHQVTIKFQGGTCPLVPDGQVHVI